MLRTLRSEIARQRPVELLCLRSTFGPTDWVLLWQEAPVLQTTDPERFRGRSGASSTSFALASVMSRRNNCWQLRLCNQFKFCSGRQFHVQPTMDDFELHVQYNQQFDIQTNKLS
jgi:hypothetical protein